MQGRLKSYRGRGYPDSHYEVLHVSSVHGYQPAHAIGYLQASRGRNEKSLAEIPRGISKRKPSANLRSVPVSKKCCGERWKWDGPKKAVNVL